MTQGFYNRVVGELKSLGFFKIRGGKGSHEKWANESGRVLIVQRNMKSRHTANGILKDSGSSVRL